MKRFLSVNLILLLSLVMVLSIFAPVSVGAAEDYDFLRLKETVDPVIARINNTLTISIVGVKGEVVTDLTSADGLVFSSSDEEVATVNENGVITGKMTGVAAITATLGELKTGISVLVQPSKVWPARNTEDGTSYANSNYAAKSYLVDDFYMSGTKSIKLPTLNTSTSLTAISVYGGIYESVGAGQIWFYDDMTPGTKFSLQFLSGKSAENKRLNERIGSDGTVYKCISTESGTRGASIPRSKGWHQMVIAADGTDVEILIDGIVVLSNKQYATAQIYSSLNYYAEPNSAEGYVWLDDLCGPILVPTEYDVTYQVEDKGSIKVNGESVSNGTVKIAQGKVLNIEGIGNAGYELDKVSFGGTDYPATNGKVSLTVTKAGTLSATFKARAVEAPSITLTEGTGDYEGIYVYADINDYYAPDFDLSEYGVNIWKTENSANKIALKSMAGFAPNTKVGFRVYGSAITAGQSFTFKPYMSGFTKLFGSDFGENYVYSDVLKYNALTTENGALKVTNPENKNTVYYLKDVDWIPGKTYRVSFRLKGDSSSPKMNLTVNGVYQAFTKEIIGVNTTKANNFTALASGLVPTEEWKDYSVTFKYTGTEEKTHDIYFSFDRSGSSPNYSYAQGTYYIDDLVVEETAVAQEIGEELQVTCK